MSQWPTYPESGGLMPGASDQEPVAPPLPVVLNPAPLPDLAQRYASRGQSADNPVIYAAGGETFRKTGEWIVPPFIKVQGGVGTVILDMQRASTVSALTSIEVSGGLGTILVVLPEGWGADISAITPGLGSRRCKVSEIPQSGMPFFYFTGSLMLGSFTVRHPTRWDLWRLRRELRREQRRMEQNQRQIEQGLR